MTAASFDTHRIVKRLKDAGATDALAEAFTDVLRENREVDLSQLATKNDVALLRQELQFTEQRITIRLGSMTVIAVGVMAMLVELL